MEGDKNLLVIAVTEHLPKEDDDLQAEEAEEAVAPELSAQLLVKNRDKFEVLGDIVDWWLYVKNIESEEKGYIPITCVVPLKDDLTDEE